MYLDLVSLVCPHYKIVSDAAGLKVARYPQRQSVTAGFARALAHHERALGLLAQNLQRYFSEK